MPSEADVDEEAMLQLALRESLSMSQGGVRAPPPRVETRPETLSKPVEALTRPETPSKPVEDLEAKVAYLRYELGLRGTPAEVVKQAAAMLGEDPNTAGLSTNDIADIADRCLQVLSSATTYRELTPPPPPPDPARPASMQVLTTAPPPPAYPAPTARVPLRSALRRADSPSLTTAPEPPATAHHGAIGRSPPAVMSEEEQLAWAMRESLEESTAASAAGAPAQHGAPVKNAAKCDT